MKWARETTAELLRQHGGTLRAVENLKSFAKQPWRLGRLFIIDITPAYHYIATEHPWLPLWGHGLRLQMPAIWLGDLGVRLLPLPGCDGRAKRPPYSPRPLPTPATAVWRTGRAGAQFDADERHCAPHRGPRLGGVRGFISSAPSAQALNPNTHMRSRSTNAPQQLGARLKTPP